MKWVPQVAIRGRTNWNVFSSAAGLVVPGCQTNRIKKFSGGNWATGQPKPSFETFASALLAASGDLAGKITYVQIRNIEPLSHNLKNIGKLSSTEIH